MNQQIQPVKSKYSHCPACRIELTFESNYAEPHIRAVTKSAISKALPDLIGFQFQCRRCSYEWIEAAEPIKLNYKLQNKLC